MEIKKKVVIKKNRYVDSVALMNAASSAMSVKGVINAESGMCTPANQEVLIKSGYDIPEGTGPDDLVIAVTADTKTTLGIALSKIEGLLDGGAGMAREYKTLDEVDADEYDLVQISLPGEYATEEAERALRKGLDVFIFSDNVPISQEIKLKELGMQLNRLVMGPDCGVGLINGVSLGAGSIVMDGPIGIVGASGSGAQEVACIIEKCGLGVSAIIGTGGRDLYPQIGGMMMLEGIRRLDADSNTEVIVLVSKLADQTVMAKVLDFADTAKKPVVAVFLGGQEELFEGRKTVGAYSLEQAALEAVKIVTGKEPLFGLTDEEFDATVAIEIKKHKGKKAFLRGLYCGGTFTEEGLIYYNKTLPGVKLYSNLKTQYADKLQDYNQSLGHTVLDLGSEEFTADAPHPVFDPLLRLKRFGKELQDKDATIFTLDFILGPGVHCDPVSAFAYECKQAMDARGGSITVIANICGAKQDPQDIEKCERILKENGVIVTHSNYQTSRLAGKIINGTEVAK